MDKAIVFLFNEKSNCCACAACLNVCPKNAIIMKEGEDGFLYPYININRCVQCGKCQQVCNYQNRINEDKPMSAYAGMAVDDEILKSSSSGGIFAILGRYVLNKGGVIYGCSLELYENGLRPEHIRIDSLSQLWKLQGSKYVQSNIGLIYRTVLKDLEKNKFVLFTGTPCQIDALYGFLGQKDYANLLTLDIICHGVPSEKMFADYLHVLQNKLKGRIVSFSFRDKSDGWGLKGAVEFIDIKGNKKKRAIPISLSSYYKLFLTSEIYRENCYTCKYAKYSRVGDITIGDYWGIEIEHPELLVKNGGPMDIKKGVSCILVNTKKGEDALKNICNSLLIEKSSIEKIARHNNQLRRPSTYTEKRQQIFMFYKKNGYEKVETWYYQSLGWKLYAYEVKYFVIRLFKR